MTTIAVTGSTGLLGGRIARRLAAADVPQRLIVRDASRAPDLPHTELAVATYRDGEAARTALTGVDVLLMVSGSENPDRVAEHRSFIDAAAAAGVGHVVYTSFLGAAPDAVFTLGRDHWATEEHLRASGMRHTFLRDNLYADFLPSMVGADGVIRGPAGEGRLSAVAQDDIADIAVTVLTHADDHVDTTYLMTGPEALTLDEIATVIAQGTRRDVRYQRETVDEAYASRASYGAPDWQVDAWVSTYTAVAAGEMAEVSEDIPRITGHPATSLAELLRR